MKMTPIFCKAVMYLCLGLAIVNGMFTLVNIIQGDTILTFTGILLTGVSIVFAYLWKEIYDNTKKLL